jgi:hypothetical protein
VYKKKCDKLVKAAQAAAARRQNNISEEKSTTDWRKEVDEMILAVQGKIDNLEEAVGRHVGMCANKANYLEGRVIKHSEKITDLKHKSMDLIHAVDRLKAPSEKLIIGVKADLKQIRQDYRSLKSDFDSKLGYVSSLKESMSSIKAKLISVDKLKSDKKEVNDQLASHISMIRILNEDCLKKVASKKDEHTVTTPETPPAVIFGPLPPPAITPTLTSASGQRPPSESQRNRVGVTVDSTEAHLQAKNCIPVIIGSKPVSTEPVEATNPTTVPVGETNDAGPHIAGCITSDNIPVIVGGRTSDSGDTKLKRNQITKKDGEAESVFYIGNIIEGSTEEHIWNFLVQNDVTPTFISLKPNKVRQGYLGAKLHIKSQDADKLQNQITWPTVAYCRPWNRK